MKRIHLLRTTVSADAAADLFAAARAADLRIGWLDLSSEPAATAPTAAPDRELARAADLGALRAVSLADGTAVTVKRVAGPPVLRDLLREHFLGCTAVLVRVPAGDAEPGVAGVGDLPRLEPSAPGTDVWRVVPRVGGPDEAAIRLTAAELVARLRRPRPWGESPSRSASRSD